MLCQRIVHGCILAALLGACSPAPDEPSDKVWTSDSTRFSLRVSGGFPPPPTPGGCSLQDYTVTWEAATGRLAMRGCYGSRTVDASARLDAAGRAAVSSQLAALAVSAERGCGADFPDYVLTVTTAAGARTYNSTFYAGCPARTVAPPFISSDALARFGASLVNTLQTCAAGDAGVTCADAGPAGP
ncbi:MAG: hypothetical protein U0324_33435 [Polyangiales bacterium]